MSLHVSRIFYFNMSKNVNLRNTKSYEKYEMRISRLWLNIRIELILLRVFFGALFRELIQLFQKNDTNFYFTNSTFAKATVAKGGGERGRTDDLLNANQAL